MLFAISLINLVSRCLMEVDHQSIDMRWPRHGSWYMLRKRFHWTCVWLFMLSVSLGLPWGISWIDQIINVCCVRFSNGQLDIMWNADIVSRALHFYRLCDYTSFLDYMYYETVSFQLFNFLFGKRSCNRLIVFDSNGIFCYFLLWQ